jgi:uncharacterized protein (DUF1697 family)
MSAVICLLRGVNVGGKNLIKMEALRAMAAALGWKDPRTLLQSGNMVVDAGKTPATTVADALSDRIERELGFRPTVVVRTATQLQKAVEANPYSPYARDDPKHLVIMFLAAAPARAAESALRAAIKGREVLTLKGSELYIYYPDGIGKSKLTNAVIERHLGTPGTARNWDTVTALEKLARAS